MKLVERDVEGGQAALLDRAVLETGKRVAQDLVGFGLHLIGHWARDRGVITIEEAVRKLTSQPAAIFGIKDRGRLAPGLAADLLLFDPATVGRSDKRKVNDLPSGAPRLTTSAKGVHGVWVNGTRLADAGGLTAGGATPGKVLRDFAA